LREFAAQLEEVGIEPTARAEEVSPALYVALARACAAAA
jgi:16S rRNA A1518/A1519 N6-dimethyltransferase RsmA/KsgA/DIM1 with predicted DNA glycosylase/AP lyase activity